MPPPRPGPRRCPCALPRPPGDKALFVRLQMCDEQPGPGGKCVTKEASPRKVGGSCPVAGGTLSDGHATTHSGEDQGQRFPEVTAGIAHVGKGRRCPRPLLFLLCRQRPLGFGEHLEHACTAHASRTLRAGGPGCPHLEASRRRTVKTFLNCDGGYDNTTTACPGKRLRGQ